MQNVHCSIDSFCTNMQKTCRKHAENMPKNIHLPIFYMNKYEKNASVYVDAYFAYGCICYR